MKFTKIYILKKMSIKRIRIYHIKQYLLIKRCPFCLENVIYVQRRQQFLQPPVITCSRSTLRIFFLKLLIDSAFFTSLLSLDHITGPTYLRLCLP